MADAIESSTEKKETTEPNTEDDLPQKILERYTSDQQVQLIKGYRILQILMYYLSNSPFFEKPENEKVGTKCYYDVIKSPMWFNEMKRKFFNAEYLSLLDVVKDMRLIFENCYYFWGPKTYMAEQCLKMERLMEKQLLILPKDLKNTCTLEETHGKNEDEIVTKIWNRNRNKGKGCSNLMLRMWRKRRIAENEEYKSKSELPKFCEGCKRTEILKWENEVLLLSDNSNHIRSVVQLPQIGLFFSLVQDVIKLEPLCQIEIERMFLIPQYSSTFRKLLSVLLADEESSEILPYEELMSKLDDTISEWYTIYESNSQDDVEATQKIGIEPEFFRIVGEVNPLSSQKYDQLPYRKKVVILKSLCDYFVHRNSAIKEVIANSNETEFFPETMGRDKLGFSYLVYKTFLDFRLYKQKFREEETSKEYLTDKEKTTLKRFFSKGSTNFEMVADSIEGIRCVIDDLIYSDMETKKDTKSANSEVIDKLRRLETEVTANEDEYIHLNNQVRIKLFKEWKEMYTSENPAAGEFVLPVDNDLEPEDNFPDEDDDEEGLTYDEETNSVGDTLFVETANLADEPSEPSADSYNRDDDDDDDDDGGGGDDDDDDDDDYDDDDDDDNNEADPIIKTEIKEEMQTDDSTELENSANTRRRRSSVPSYNVFGNELYFSDLSDDDSPEEMYTEGDDSDDDWRVPSKRSKTKITGKSKLSKQLKQQLNAAAAAASSSSEEKKKRRRKRRKRTRRSSTAVVEKDEGEETTTAAAADSSSSSSLTQCFVESNGIVIKEEIDDIDSTIEIKKEKDEEVEKERRAERKGKKVEEDEEASESTALVAATTTTTTTTSSSSSKIKVVDFAKLQSTKSETAAADSAVMVQEEEEQQQQQQPLVSQNRIIKTVCVSSNDDNPSLPLPRPSAPSATMLLNANSSFPSAARPTIAAVMGAGQQQQQQPRVISNAYTVTRARPMSRPGGRLGDPLYAGGPNVVVAGAAGRMQMAATTRFVNATAVAAGHNSKLMFLNPTTTRSRGPPPAIGVFKGASPRDPAHGLIRVSHRYPTAAAAASASLRQQTTNAYNSSPGTGVVAASKLGRNITIVPKMVTITDPKEKAYIFREIEGTIGIHSNNGTLQYVVNLANGTHVPLTNEQVQKLRNGNNGALPLKLKIPVPMDVAEKIEPCVVIDD